MGYLAAYAVREMNGYTLIRLNGPNLKRGQFQYLYLINQESSFQLGHTFNTFPAQCINLDTLERVS